MKPEQINALKVAASKARTYLINAQNYAPSLRNVREVEGQLEELLRIVEAVVERPGPVPSAPSFNDAASTAPAKPLHPWPAPTRNPAPTQAIGLMRSYLELPGSEVLPADKWAKRVAGYLFENLGSLP